MASTNTSHLPEKIPTATTTTPSPPQPPHPPIPPSFNPGPKLSADGKTLFYKNPAREEFDRRWRERVARGEDPLKALPSQVESTGSSSFIEIWWRKARGKQPTRSAEKEAQERRARERVEGGRAALLGGEGEGDGVDGVESSVEEKEEVERERKKKKKLHDRLRWGI